MLPQGMRAVLRKKMWPRPELFNWLQKNGNVAEAEMHRVFNCGIGMVIAVAREHAAAATTLLKNEGELAYEIGFVEAGNAGEPEAMVL
jgi:phosphoribosylformylglycinamidine cyclo-ligase